jgi:hypothetical protein
LVSTFSVFSALSDLAAMFGSLQMCSVNFGVNGTARGKLAVKEMNRLNPNGSEWFVSKGINQSCQTFPVADELDATECQVRFELACLAQKSELAQFFVESLRQRRKLLGRAVQSRPDHARELAEAAEFALDWRDFHSSRVHRFLDAWQEFSCCLAQKFQGEMEILRRDPTDFGVNVPKSALRPGQLLANPVIDLDCDEQPHTDW